MKKLSVFIIFILISFQIISAQDYGKIFLLDIVVYKNDSVQLNELREAQGTPNVENLLGTGYKIRLVSDSNSVLFEKEFLIGFSGHGISTSGKPVEFNDTSKNLVFRLPAPEGATKLQLLHESKIIFSKDLPGVSKPIQTSSSYSIYIYLAILIVAVILLVFLLLRRKNSHQYENLKQKWS
ncbi:MAG: hypothetical protein J4452_02635 [Candidatus Aenigmarchaeota archaeon]|nr:hypothetical protein [Candidatus Aenigmarchaeota archaeon]